MQGFHTSVRFLFFLIYAREFCDCLSKNNKSNDESSTNTPTLSSFQQYTNAIPSEQPVRSHGRRDVETSVKANAWPSTIFSPLCEAWAYFESSIEDTKATRNSIALSWMYLDALVERGGVESLDHWIDSQSKDGQSRFTYDNSTELALEIASQMLHSNESTQTLDETLLPMALSLRAYAPHCEMHRSLARDAAVAFGLYDIEKARLPPSAFCVISRRDGENIVGTRLIIDASLIRKAVDELKLAESSEENDQEVISDLLTQLPGESSHPTTSSENNAEFVAILYGHVGTSAFTSLYKALKTSQIYFVVRHMGFIPFEESKDASVAFPTVMQGYGVRLDIRNVEYKAFDDGPDDDANDGDTKLDWGTAGHHPEHSARKEYLGGLNLDTIFERLQVDNTRPLATDLGALQTAAIRSHTFQLGSESIIPPAWKRRSLSMQAARLIVDSPDPLEVLMGVSQNLPSVAHSLSNIQINESFEDLAEKATNLATKIGAVSHGWGDAAFGLYINSREVDIERPSFNVFQLLKVLREQDAILKSLEMHVRPALKQAALVLGSGEKEWSALQSVRKMMDIGAEKLAGIGKSGDLVTMNPIENEAIESEEYENEQIENEEPKFFRVDVGRGGKNAVMYLNDVEKDPEYSSWPTSIQEMLYRAQFGGAPTVRRNLFTMLLVIDPASGKPNPVLDVVAQLMNAQLPLRLGVLIVNNDDIENGLSSESLPWDNGDRPVHASDSFLLIKHITWKYGGMIAISCLVQFLHKFEEMDENIPVKEYVNEHALLLAHMGVIHESHLSSVQKELLDLLRSRNGEVNDSSSKTKNVDYKSAVQFAKDKVIRPGMSFYNGIPLPTTTEKFGSKMNDILHGEQNHILELAMNGIITDSTPRSVYATILSGDNIYKQYHPLLDESSSGEYFIASTNSDEASLILLPSNSDYSGTDALFVVEAVINLDDPSGIEAASSFLELIASAPSQSWHDSKSVSLAARVVPVGEYNMSPASKVLGSLFCAASKFDTTHLKTVVDNIMHTNLEVIAVTDFFNKVEGLSASVRRQMIEVVTESKQCHGNTMHEGKNIVYTANGRAYIPHGSPLITLNDIKMLVNLELDRSVAITKSILANLSPFAATNDDIVRRRIIHHAIGRSAAVLNVFFSSSSKSSSSSDLISDLNSLSSEDNPLFFSWNDDTALQTLQVRTLL